VSDNRVFRLTHLAKAEAVLTLPEVSSLSHISELRPAPGGKAN
jgi:hypothetical protein